MKEVNDIILGGDFIFINEDEMAELMLKAADTLAGWSDGKDHLFTYDTLIRCAKVLQFQLPDPFKYEGRFDFRKEIYQKIVDEIDPKPGFAHFIKEWAKRWASGTDIESELDDSTFFVIDAAFKLVWGLSVEDKEDEILGMAQDIIKGDIAKAMLLYGVANDGVGEADRQY